MHYIFNRLGKFVGTKLFIRSFVKMSTGALKLLYRLVYIPFSCCSWIVIGFWIITHLKFSTSQTLLLRCHSVTKGHHKCTVGAQYITQIISINIAGNLIMSCSKMYRNWWYQISNNEHFTYIFYIYQIEFDKWPN